MPPSTAATETDAPAGPRPFQGTLVDLGFRTAYRVAHRMLRAWWRVRRPKTTGALVAVWHDGAILLVKNSYRRHYTLPGGYVRRGETPAQAGARELAEEVDIDVDAASIREVYHGVHPFENRADEVYIVELDVDRRPVFAIDNREVVWAGFKTPQQALRMEIVPHLREYLEDRDG